MTGKFKGKYIVSDFDGTLANQSVIPKANVEAVRYFTDYGGIFSINTGRHLTSIRNAVRGSGIVINGPLLCCNSALVYDEANRRKITAWEMDGKIFDVGRYILERYPNIGLEVMYDEKFFILRHDEFNSFHVGMEKLETEDIGIDEVRHPIQKMLVTGDPGELKRLEADVTALPDFDYSTTYTHPSFFEIMPKGLTKATGVKFAAEYLGIREADVVVAGDYYNDIEALRIAGLAVVPENGLPEVKAVAHKIVRDCREGAIADIVALLENK